MTDGNEQQGGKGGDGILVAEYVLGVLDADTHARVARLIEDDPDLQRAEAFWQERFSTLDTHFEEATPPPGTLPAVEARLFGARERNAGPVAAVWNSLLLWRTLAAGGVAVAVATVGIGLMQPAPVAPEDFATQLVAALEAEGSSVRYLALYDGATGSVRLTALSGEAVPDKDYELWYIQGEAAPVSLGVIPVEQGIRVDLPAGVREQVDDSTVFAISLEPEGGAPGNAPTGPIVASGAANPI